MIVKNKLHEDVLAWEVEVEDLNIDVENLDYKLQDGLFGKNVTTRFENHNKELKQKRKGLNVFPGDWGTYRKDIDGEVESRMKHILDKIKDKYKNEKGE